MKTYLTHPTFCGEYPIDRNDPHGADNAIEVALPTPFSKKAVACWDYLDGAAFLYLYKGKVVVTDESLYLTPHGDGTHNAPFGAPRWVGEGWEALETWLEESWDELAEAGLV